MTEKYKFKQLIQLFAVHAKELIREPAVLFWGFVFPILMAMGLGLAFTNKADTVINTAIIESSATPKLDHFLKNNTELLSATEDNAQLQRMIVENDKLGNTTFYFQRCSWQEAMTLLKKGKLSIIIEESYDQIKYHFDPLNPHAKLSYMKLSALLNGQPVITKQDNPDIATLTLSGSRYIDFLIPGLIALGVMMSCMWGISYGMIEKRSQKLLRRMVATPMKKSYFLMTLMTVRTMLNFLESCALFLVAWLFFGITIQGNIMALLLIFLAGNISFAGIAILVSSHTAKTEVGNGLINAVVTPMMILSGIFFSYHNFPDGLVWIIQKLPLTILADGIRSIFIEGAGLAESIIPIFILFITGVLFFLAGLRIFKWH